MNLSPLLAAILLLTSCATPKDKLATLSPTDEFYQNLSVLCGQSFAGSIVANTPAPAAPDPFEGKTLVMQLQKCDERELRLPFHVGDDHSRTWVITRQGTSLRLKHEHRHADGSPDVVTMYGGDTRDSGSARRQEFPIDAESATLFQKQGMLASLSNVWAMELEPRKNFVYELRRPDGRLFRVEFDLTRPVAAPPLPWGASN